VTSNLGYAHAVAASSLDRRDLLRLSAAGLLAAVPAGATGLRRAAAQDSVSLELDFLTPESVMQPLVDAYTEQNPNVEIGTTYAMADQYQAAVRTELTSGTAADIMCVWPGNGNAMALFQLAPGGFLADLSAEPWVAQMPAGLDAVTKYEGKTTILVPGFAVIGTIYNKQVFEELGIEGHPTTWSDFLALCDTIKAAGKTPLALGLQAGWVTQLIPYAIAPSTVFAKDPEFDAKMASGEATFAGSGWAEAFEMYLELNERGYFNEDPLATPHELALELVGTGEAAMYVQVSAIIPDLEAIGGEGNFLLFPFPGADVAEEVWIPAAASAGWGVNAASENLDDAKAFLRFLAQPENLTAYSTLRSEIPAVLAEGAEVPPELAPMVPFIEAGRSYPFMDQLWPNAEVQQAHFAGVQQLFAGDATIDEVLASMDEAYQRV
jgi:raffinose/stachyose/melibiose transport system substrate-binding protein